MTLRRWLRNSIERYQTVPAPQATRANARTFKEGMYSRVGWHTADDIPDGTNIYDLPDWDVLVVLDACRPDVLRQVSREFDWLPTNEMTTYTSVGGYSLHWLEETFTEDYADAMSETGFVAWNPYTDFTDMDYGEAMAAFDAVHEYGWDNDLGCVPPEVVTDSALDMLGEVDQLVCWYMQPHTPYRTLLDEVERLNDQQIGNEYNGRLTVWNLIRSGDISRNEALLACADNLRWALDDIERLVAAADEDMSVAVTADHGELFGEHGLYGHPKQDYQREQLQVPLVPVDPSEVGSAAANGARNPGGKTPEDGAPDTATDRLEQLGYI